MIEKLLHENPDAKFLIYSRREFPYFLANNSFVRENPIGSLLGNKDVIAKTLDQFNNRSLRMIFSSSLDSMAGMNIPAITHIIFYHKVNALEEKNIIARALVPGRTTPLTLITLMHERER